MANEDQANANGTGATVTSVAASSSRSTPTHAMAPAEKPGKFSGIDFKRWQMKMFFYLTTLSLQRFIKEDPPVVAEALWNALEKKYKTEDVGLKKFVAARFLDFKMVDTRSVITQVQELQVIVHDLLAEGMVINEAFQVASFIEKLPPLWKDFKNYLKRKCKEMTLEDLIDKEDNKNAEKKSRGNSTIIRANIVEEAPQNKKRKKTSGPNNYPSKKKFKGNCHNCGKSGHKAVVCRAPKTDVQKKKNKKNQANMVENVEEMEDLCDMLSECNLVGNPKEWWIDSGVTPMFVLTRSYFLLMPPQDPTSQFSWEICLQPKLKELARLR
uniref:CCHC-type domain-containing protein n=1 Tax=Nicotiana tabacum TaxID=4097 RepID=A0A1S4AZH3_TOBAC|nr:PREDICTED: uncharacterized protein LOC107802856 [Nicotiana tabacum]